MHDHVMHRYTGGIAALIGRPVAKRPAEQIQAAKPQLQTLDSELVDLFKYYTWQRDVQRAQEYTPLVTQLFTDSIYRKQEARGDELLKKIESCIDLFFPKGRFGFQEDLHNQMLRATLMQTLGDDYRMLVNQVCRERGWSGPNKNLFTIASRRSGKTTGIASMVAALLICVPNIQIVVYSVAKRSAEEFVRLVEKYIQLHPSGRQMIKNPGGAEMLVLTGTSPGDERRIRSFPSGGNAANVSLDTPTHRYTGVDRPSHRHAHRNSQGLSEIVICSGNGDSRICTPSIAEVSRCFAFTNPHKWTRAQQSKRCNTHSLLSTWGLTCSTGRS